MAGVTITVWLQFVWLTLLNVVGMLYLVKRSVMSFRTNRESPRPCRRLRWRPTRTDHWAVIVPFMSGWTSQMKEYVPAASAGTW